MYSLERLRHFLEEEGIKFENTFKYNYKCIVLLGEVKDTKMKRVVDFCNNNSLFYALDSHSKFYIY